MEQEKYTCENKIIIPLKTNNYKNTMKILFYTCVFCGMLPFLLGACSEAGKEKTVEEEGVNTVLPDKKTEVTVVPLKRQTFYHELVSNGKMKAAEEADLNFETGGVVAKIYVKNGTRVKKNQPLAELDPFLLQNKTAQAADALAKAKLELQDVLIGQGYAVGDTASVPADVMRLAKVKSGYDQALYQYEIARYEEEHATLRAPFDGVVANLFAKPYNRVSTADAFCTVIGSNRMEVDFTVLENELPLIKQGDKVTVSPYANPGAKYEGRISEINPLVDEKGMVNVKATVASRGELFSGMNVRVKVRRELPDQLVIPKSALVLRSGKQVVFTLKNDMAIWNYVQTQLENSDSYTLVGEEIKEGDLVIATGNVNLAHEAPVTVVEETK